MEGREEDGKGPRNCDTGPTSSRLAVKIPGGGDMEMTRLAQSTLSHHYWLMCVQTISYSPC